MSNASAKPNNKAATRIRMIAAIREFFNARGFREVETPVIIKAPAPEEHIEAIPAEGGFFRASPELQMKQLLVAGHEKIYQLGLCCRKGEYGRRHRPEFTMLEWYQTGVDYRELMLFTTEMIRFVARQLSGSATINYQGRNINTDAEPDVIAVLEAYRRYGATAWRKAVEQGNEDVIMTDAIEPRLGQEKLAFLIDYPAERAALARLKPGQPEVAERWELYIAGLELANAYSELTDPAEQAERFRVAAAFRRKNGLTEYPWPEEFFAALEKGLPECAGCALGIDRLAMIFTDSADIAEIICH